MLTLFEVLDIVDLIIEQLERYFSMSKQLVIKLQYSIKVIMLLIFVMHIVACVWIRIGEDLINGPDGSWLTVQIAADDELGLEYTSQTKYITAFYWVMVTLTTVGYGDIYGYSWQEYIFTMVVEFIGIAFFSFIIGSINNVLFTDENQNMQDALFERLDIWLVKLDNSRSDKSLSKTLYQHIQTFIKEAYSYDHTKLINGYEFLEQLKPSLRSRLIQELFPKYFQLFQHLFCYENAACGKEFVSYFVSQLYCRFFLANQTILKKGEEFDELFMIFKGQVTLSL